VLAEREHGVVTRAVPSGKIWVPANRVPNAADLPGVSGNGILQPAGQLERAQSAFLQRCVCRVLADKESVFVEATGGIL